MTEYSCEFCKKIYPTLYMVHEHMNIAHGGNIGHTTTIRTLNIFITKIEAFMKQTENNINELSTRITQLDSKINKLSAL